MSDDSRLDSYFRALSHPRRRFIVRQLRDADGHLQVDEIATEIAAWKTGSGTDEETIESAQVLLYHSHLPILANNGVVDFDPESGRVATTEITAHLAAIVEIGRSIAEAEGGERDG